jgi:hypothetical protein
MLIFNYSKSNLGLIVAKKKGFKVTKKGLLISPNFKTPRKLVQRHNRYLRLRTTKNGVIYYPYLHRLQAYQKFGRKIFMKNIQVRHLDGDTRNNSWNNIELGTAQQNQLDIPIASRKEKAKKAAKMRGYCPSFTTKKHPHELIIKDYKSGMSPKELKEKYNISSSGTIHYIINK